MSEIREVSSDIIHKDSLDSKFNIDCRFNKSELNC